MGAMTLGFGKILIYMNVRKNVLIIQNVKDWGECMTLVQNLPKMLHVGLKAT
jgi:hypothetical protein